MLFGRLWLGSLSFRAPWMNNGKILLLTSSYSDSLLMDLRRFSWKRRCSNRFLLWLLNDHESLVWCRWDSASRPFGASKYHSKWSLWTLPKSNCVAFGSHRATRLHFTLGHAKSLQAAIVVHSLGTLLLARLASPKWTFNLCPRAGIIIIVYVVCLCNISLIFIFLRHVRSMHRVVSAIWTIKRWEGEAAGAYDHDDHT